MIDIKKEIEDHIAIAKDRNSCEISYKEYNGEELGYTKKDGKGSNKSFIISVSSSLNPEAKLAIFKHENGHINQDSFNEKFTSGFGKVIENYKKDFQSKHGEIKNEIDVAINMAHFSLFNLMEDIRMESRESFGRLGRHREFIDQRTRMKGDVTDVTTNPTAKLLATRFFDNDRLDEKERGTYQKIHDDLELQSHKGLLKIYRDFCKQYLHPYLDNNFKKAAEQYKKASDINEEKEQLNDQLNDIAREFSNKLEEIRKKYKSMDNSRDNIRAKYDEMSKVTEEYKKNAASFKRKMTSKRNKSMKILDDISKSSLGETNSHDVKMLERLAQREITSNRLEQANEFCPSELSYDDKELDGVDVSQEKANESKELSKRAGLIRDCGDMEIDIGDVSKHKRVKAVDKFLPRKVVSEIKRTLDTITTRKNGLTYKGSEVNLNAYLRNIQTKNTKIFNRKINKIKLSILLSVDVSGSMEGTRLESCRAIVEAIMTATKNNKAIELKAMSWSGSSDGQLAYSIIDSLSDLDKLTISHGFSNTPTAQALRKSKQVIKSMKGERKVVIFLTDGSPSIMLVNSVIRSGQEILEICNKEIKQVKRYSKLIPIFIDGKDDEISSLFKTGAINVDHRKQKLTDVLLREFRKTFMTEIR